jgi:hypothetical protein
VTTVFAGKLHVHYGQAYVFSGEEWDTGEMDACFRGQSNGLLGAAEAGVLFLMTGLHTGFVKLRVDVDDAEPEPDGSWEECVEATFTPSAADARLVTWGGEPVCELPLNEIAYRVRYQANGMDAGRDADTILEDEDEIDSYRLSFWPGPPAPDRVVRQMSGIAAYWHEWARGL